MTKTHKTMYGICKDAARRKGARKAHDGKFGYFLTVAEIREIYYQYGFSKRARNTIPGHIASWAYIGWVGYAQDADLRSPSAVIWWPCPVDQTDLTMAAERLLADTNNLVLNPPKVSFSEEDQ